MSGSPSCYLFRGNALISEQSWVFGTTGHSNQDKDVCQTGQNWRKTDKSSQIWREQQKQKHGFICWSFCSLSITFIPTCPSFPKEFTFFKIRVFFLGIFPLLWTVYTVLLPPFCLEKKNRSKSSIIPPVIKFLNMSMGDNQPRDARREKFSVYCFGFCLFLLFCVCGVWCVRMSGGSQFPLRHICHLLPFWYSSNVNQSA